MNNQNNCTNNRENIASLVLGLLEAKDAERLQKHMEACQNCRVFYQDMLEEEKGIRTSFNEIAQKSKTIQDSLIEKLKENEGDNPDHRKIIKIRQNRFKINTLIKFAAAAVIVLAALFTFNNGSFISTPAFGLDEVIEAYNNAQWLLSRHVFINAKNGAADISSGYWRGVNPYRTISLDSNKIIYNELTLGKEIVYHPTSNTITISYRRQSKEDYRNITDLIFSELALYKERGVKVTYKNGELDGRPAMIINVDYSTSSFYKIDSGYTMYVDPETRLPVRVQSNDKNADPNHYIVYDFPDKGPEDIYEAGAPRDAKVIITHSKDNLFISNTPDVPELVRDLWRYNVSRDNLLSDYILITTYEYDSSMRILDVVYHQGKNLNENQRSISYSARDLYELINDNGTFEKKYESLLEWSKVKNNYFQNIRIKHNGSVYSGAWTGSTDSWITEGKRNWPVKINNIIDWGWPEILPKKNVRRIENEYSRENGLVAFERTTEPEIANGKLMNPAQKDIYYLDPGHDYMCVRKEEYKHFILGGIPIEEITFDINDISSEISYVQYVSQFGKTEDGQWYPEKIETHSKTWDADGKAQPLSLSFTVTLYLKANSVFPERFFNPEHSPMPEE